MKLLIIISVTLLFISTHQIANAQSLDELLGLDDDTSPTNEQTPSQEQTVQAVDTVDDDKMKRALSGQDPSDLFEKVIVEMNDVSRRLKDKHVGLQTQREQIEIISKLDQIIAQAKQQQSSSGKSSQNQKHKQSQSDRSGKSQAKQSKASSQKGKIQTKAGENKGQAGVSSSSQATSDDKALRETRMEWGQLPERVRKEVEEGMNERFSSKYRRLTEQYYKRLAETKSGESAEDDSY
ncbi:hypothetical protein JD969_09895 [Planctomycetota bacterium]|nr:hypothetical protein JD969_09895 [Planctomycetota bacterium]